jgi:Ca-activated chloride channel homolog
MQAYRVRTAVLVTITEVCLLATSYSASYNQGYHYNALVQRRQKVKTPQRRNQEPLADNDKEIKLRADLVSLDVTVVDSDKRLVTNLNREHFQVYEDGKLQRMEYFSKEQSPISLMLAIDVSASMESKLNAIKQACTSLVAQMRPEDEIAITEFRDEVNPLKKFSTDIKELTETLKILTAKGRTRMLDALYQTAEITSGTAKNRRKAVILFTDGLDLGSIKRIKEVTSYLRKVDLQIYLIGFTTGLDDESNWNFIMSDKERAETLLEYIASEVGGVTFFPKGIVQVQNSTEQVLAELRTQYSIGYYPTNTKRDGSFRTVTVEVKRGRQHLFPRTRRGYIAPKEST